MNSNELRLGNWITYSGKPFKVEALTDEHLVAYYRNWGGDEAYHPIEDYQPIPLTPDILEKCGFEKDEDAGNWAFPNFIIWKLAETYFMIGFKDDVFHYYQKTDDDYYSSMWPRIQFLHQLQNLYFALTGEELNINL